MLNKYTKAIRMLTVLGLGFFIFSLAQASDTYFPHSEKVSQEDITVSGIVTNVQGEVLIGVNVVVKGTNNGTSTDFDGRYELSGVPEDGYLIFSYVGYQNLEIAIKGQTVLDVQLMEDVQLLDELVVVGYGTVKKSDLTGSVQRIDGSTFENQPMTQITDMLTGTVAGFNANQSASAEGGSSLEIRGPTSLNANTEPLIVLDGVIYNGRLGDISPNDIESIDILKDASSAAVYGARAASGVIIVTTKKGTTGKPVIQFSTEWGLAEVANSSIRPLNGEQYTDFRRDLLILENPNQPDFYFHHPNDLPTSVSVDEWYNYNPNPNADQTTEWLNRLLFYPTEVENYLAGKEEDWYSRSIHKGIRQNYDLSINGGSEAIRYYWSMGYAQNEGVVVGDEFATLRSRLNVSAKISDFLTVGVNAQYANRDNSSVPINLSQTYVSSPYGSMFEEDGSVRWYPNDYLGFVNPLVNHLLQDKLDKTNTLFSSFYSQVQLPLGFSYKLSFQPRFSFGNDYNFWGSDTPNGANSHSMGYGTRTDSKTYEWMLDHLLKWNQTYDVHQFDVTFLYNLEKFQTWSSFQSGESFAPNENLSFNALQFATNYIISNNDQYSTGDALMARLNYTLMDKYLLTASVRRDGYSGFGQGNPRATFPAIALAWKLSNESFFQSNWISTLKLRASWGVNGNREIGRYAALARLAQNIYSNGAGPLIGVFNNSLANPNLVWEKTEALNFGVDFGLFEGRVSGSVEAYHIVTNDLLMQRNLPQITGFDFITSNLGELQNRGLELSLQGIVMDQAAFQWKSSLIFSLNRNKINGLFGDFEEVEIDGETVRREVSDYTNQWFIGEALDRIWDYEITGIWQVEERDAANVYGLSPGDYKAVDVNDDGVYSALEDKQFIGYRQPRYRISLRNEFSFLKHFSAAIFLRSDLGHKGAISDFEHSNSNLYDRRGMRNVPYWTEANPSNRYGSLTATSGAYGGGYNLYFDRSFLRIQDVSLSYQMPDAWVEKVQLDRLRLYGSIRNLYSFDQWEHWDPESGANPMPRIYTVGINVSL